MNPQILEKIRRSAERILDCCRTNNLAWDCRNCRITINRCYGVINTQYAEKGRDFYISVKPASVVIHGTMRYPFNDSWMWEHHQALEKLSLDLEKKLRVLV